MCAAPWHLCVTGMFIEKDNSQWWLHNIQEHNLSGLRGSAGKLIFDKPDWGKINKKVLNNFDFSDIIVTETFNRKIIQHVNRKLHF